MTSPSAPPPGPGAKDSPAPYPVPYEEPWGRLATDLRAVMASLGLKLRELWRRNRQGDLSVPGFWPASLASLFWPLLLASAVALVLALPRLPTPHPAASPFEAPQRGPLVPSAEPPAEPPMDSAIATPAEFPAPQPEPEPLLQLDPLLALLAEDDPDGWIASVRPDPQQGRLDLEMAPSFLVLPQARRQLQADTWLQRGRDLGYEQLRLLDPGGALLGQAARVGSGMVLLEPSLGPEA